MLKRSFIKNFLMKFWNKKDIILLNLIFSLLTGSLQEIQMFFALQMINISFSSTYNKISFACAIIWICYEVAILLYLSKIFLSLNPDVAEKINIKKKLSTFRAKTKTSQPKLQSKKAYTELEKEKFSFLFGQLIKENERGMSYFFYKLLKKMIIHCIVHTII